MCALLKNRTRVFFALELVATIVILGVILQVQSYLHLVPCALCSLQRMLFGGLSCCFAVGIFRNWQRCGQLFIHGTSMILSILGASLALRQIWLQNHPIVSSLGTCDIGIFYLLKIMSWQDAIKHILQGGDSCSQAEWYFWHLSFAHYSCLVFIIFAGLASWKIVQLICKSKACS